MRFVKNQWEGDKTAWLDYASERKGRFVGLQNKVGLQQHVRHPAEFL